MGPLQEMKKEGKGRLLLSVVDEGEGCGEVIYADISRESIQCFQSFVLWLGFATRRPCDRDSDRILSR